MTLSMSRTTNVDPAGNAGLARRAPLQPGPPWLSMGTRSLDLDRWLITDGNFAPKLELKATLLRERPRR